MAFWAAKWHQVQADAVAKKADVCFSERRTT